MSITTSSGIIHSPTGNGYFDFLQNPQYDRDREVYKLVTSESINLYGEPCEFYSVTWDTNYDFLYGEDDDRTLIRKFLVKSWFELPSETDQFTSFGLEELDNFMMYISSDSFSYFSQYDSSGTLFPVVSGAVTSAYGAILPKSGDVIRPLYGSKIFYEILKVEQQTGMFLSTKFIYNFIVRKMKNNRFALSATTSADMSDFISEVQRDDMYAHNDYISSAISAVSYNPPGTETPSNQQDPLNGW